MLHLLRRSAPFITLLALGIAWIGHTKIPSPAKPVNIPDTNLRSVIERALDKPTGAIITNVDMATLTDSLEGAGLISAI